MLKARLFSLSIVLLLLGACDQKTTQEAEKPLAGSFADNEADTSRLPVRMIDPDSLRNMSFLLAGKIAPEDAEELDPVWLEHARFMDEAWTEIDLRLADMKTWAVQEGVAADTAEAPLLYPLGGPDLISAMQFFPQASSYLLIGLEAPGHLPEPEGFSAQALSADLKRLRKPFSSFVQHGYFVRNEIDKDLSGGQFDGVLPIILIGLVRAGQVPLSLQYVEIDRETYAIVPAGPESKSAHAVLIQFQDENKLEDPEAKPRSVYYFSKDLSDRRFFSDEPFSRFIERQEMVNSYLKSAEYLLHTDDFSNFRKLVLKKTHTLLQDDSGIPIRFLTSDTWDIRLYGQYSSVLAAYSHWLQEDLVAAFAKGKAVGELGFDLGYNSKTDGGNLILSVRKTDDAAAP